MPDAEGVKDCQELRDLTPRGGVSGPRYAGARARVEQGSSLALAEQKLFAEIYFFCALTPELSRAAKRRRLE